MSDIIYHYVVLANKLEQQYADLLLLDWMEQVLENKMGLRLQPPDSSLLVRTRGVGDKQPQQSDEIFMQTQRQQSVFETIGFALDPFLTDIGARKTPEVDTKKPPTLQEMQELSKKYDQLLEERTTQLLVLIKMFTATFATGS